MTQSPRVVGDEPKLRSVQWSLVASFASLAFAIFANLVAVPIYIRSLGAEAYGLIGFYALLTAGFQVFDFGLSATMARECSRFRGGSLSGAVLWRVLTGFEIIFLAVALSSAAALVGFAPLIATHWLKLETMPVNTVSTALHYLGFAIPLQWVTGLYRGVQIGFERQVLLSVLNIIFAFARFFGVLAALSLFDATIETFFAYQALLALTELAIFALFSRGMMPGRREKFSLAVFDELVRNLKFTSAIGVVTICWIVITQGDRFILSNILTMPNFGIFTLAVTASSTLVTMSTPLSQALLPRLTVLHAQGQIAGALALYRNGTQLAAVAALPAALVFCLFSKQVLWIWTGDPILAGRAAPILSAYALGSGIVPLTAFSYYLQYSRGELRLHMIGQGLMTALFLPAVLFAASWFGAVAVGLVWTALNIAYLVFWAGIVHNRLAPGLHLTWLLKDIGAIFAPAALLGLALRLILKWPDDRLIAAAELFVVCALILSAAAAGSSSAREWIWSEGRKILNGGAAV